MLLKNKTSSGLREIWTGVIWGLMTMLTFTLNSNLLAEVAVTSPQTTDLKTFYLREIRVRGGTGKLSPLEIQTLIYPYLGPGKTMMDVESARRDLENAYGKKGYATLVVEAPSEVVRGVAIFTVDQGKLEHFHITGAKFMEPDQIRKDIPALTPGTVPNFNDVNDQVNAFNQIHSTHTIGLQGGGIAPGDTPGNVNAKFVVNDAPPWSGSVELNNRYSLNTVPLRINTNLSYDNLWQLGHQVHGYYQVAPQDPNEVTAYGGDYTAHFRDLSWLSLELLGSKSDSNVANSGTSSSSSASTTAGGASNTNGKGDTIGVSAKFELPVAQRVLPEGKNYSLQSETGFEHNISLGIDYKRYYSAQIINGEIVDTGGQNTPVPVTYYPLNINYFAQWTDKDSNSTILNAALNYEIQGTAERPRTTGGSPSAFDSTRFKADDNYIYLKVDLSRTQKLPGDFLFYAHFQGQLADQPLVNSEQYGVGGLDTIRGYVESEVLADNGILGNFELQTPSLGQFFSGSVVEDWRFFSFLDAGYFTIYDPLPEQQVDFNLTSIGAGMRLSILQNFDGNVDLALPISAGPSTKAFDPRFDFSVTAKF